MIIKEFEEKYVDDVIDLILSIQQKEFNIEITLKDQPDLKMIPSFYQKGSGNFWTALSEDEVVGTLGLIDIGENICALRKMFVKTEFRGKEYNIASKLVEKALEHCRAKGVKTILLGTTSKYHAAHRFYEKTGFSEISKNDLPDIFPVMEVDSKFYSYKL